MFLHASDWRMHGFAQYYIGLSSNSIFYDEIEDEKIEESLKLNFAKINAYEISKIKI